MLNKIKNLFTNDLQVAVDIQKEQLRLEKERSESLERELIEAIEHLQFVTPLLSDRCPPDNLNQLSIVREFLKGKCHE
jgi:hypothetical protein